MKLVYWQPYTKKRATKCWYGKPPKHVQKHFKHDKIALQIPDSTEKFWMTADEAADIIRALSAGLHHWLVKEKSVKHIIKAKSK